MFPISCGSLGLRHDSFEPKPTYIMGPILKSSVSLSYGVEVGARLSTPRNIRIPLQYLSRMMHSMHIRGVTVSSVSFTPISREVTPASSTSKPISEPAPKKKPAARSKKTTPTPEVKKSSARRSKK